MSFLKKIIIHINIYHKEFGLSLLSSFHYMHYQSAMLEQCRYN